MRGNVFNATVFCVVLLSHHIAMASGDDESCAPKSGGSDANWGAVLAEARRLLEPHGASVALIEPFGAEIAGLKLAELAGTNDLKHGSALATALELLMAHVGVLVFRGQGLLSPSEQIAASALFGAGKLHSTHEWHCDGSFLEDVFSHAGYHIVQLPNVPAGTSFAHLGHAYEMLSAEEKEVMGRLASVNSNGGVVHPLVHTHPLSGRPSLFLHLAMTGAVVHVQEGSAAGAGGTYGGKTVRGMDEEQLVSLFQRVSLLLNHPDVAYHHHYQTGDFVVVDNWAAAHRAFPGSFDAGQGVRVVHRTTVKSPRSLSPPASFSLPAAFPQSGQPPKSFQASAPGRSPVWVEGYLGLRWRRCEASDLQGQRSPGQVKMQTPCFSAEDLEEAVRGGGRGKWAARDLNGAWLSVAG